MQLCEQRIRRYLGSLIGPDGVVHNPETGQPDHMFSQGRALYDLVTDNETGRRAELKPHIERFIARLDPSGRLQPACQALFVAISAPRQCARKS